MQLKGHTGLVPRTSLKPLRTDNERSDHGYIADIFCNLEYVGLRYEHGGCSQRMVGVHHWLRRKDTHGSVIAIALDIPEVTKNKFYYSFETIITFIKYLYYDGKHNMTLIYFIS